MFKIKQANFMPYEWLCHLTSFEVYYMYYHFFFTFESNKIYNFYDKFLSIR